jgi:hypothetical protein
MDYNLRKIELFRDIDKNIKHNIFYFNIYNVGNNFYNMYLGSTNIIGDMKQDIYIDISILFEFLLNNYTIFGDLLDNKSTNHNLDMLCFFNLNIYILTSLNTILVGMNIDKLIMKDIINITNNCFTDDSLLNLKKKMFCAFNKIIEIR